MDILRLAHEASDSVLLAAQVSATPIFFPWRLRPGATLFFRVAPEQMGTNILKPVFMTLFAISTLRGWWPSLQLTIGH